MTLHLPRALAPEGVFRSSLAAPLTPPRERRQPRHSPPLDRVQLAPSAPHWPPLPSPQHHPSQIPPSPPQMLGGVPASPRAHELCRAAKQRHPKRPGKHPGGWKIPLTLVCSLCRTVLRVLFNQRPPSMHRGEQSEGEHPAPFCGCPRCSGEDLAPHSERKGAGPEARSCFL